MRRGELIEEIALNSALARLRIGTYQTGNARLLIQILSLGLVRLMACHGSQGLKLGVGRGIEMLVGHELARGIG